MTTACLAAWLLFGGIQALAGEEIALFEFRGQILGDNRRPIHDPEPVVFLHGATLPYNGTARVGLDGSFKFQKLRAGSYVLIIAVPGQGEMRRTVDVTASLADRKRRVRETIRFSPSVSSEEIGLVHKSQLSVPRKARDQFQRALRELGENDVEAAKACLDEAIRLAPHYAEAWNQLGVIAYQTAHFAEAERYFRRALKEEPTAFYALVNLGGALLSLEGKDAEALEINQQAVRRAPEDALAQSQLGKTHLRLGQLDEAEKHLRQAIALDPRHFSAPQLSLADLYLMQGRMEERIREMEEYLKHHPDGAFAPRVRELLQRVGTTPPPQ
jgi:Tfp pilus assembly protein PilF